MQLRFAAVVAAFVCVSSARAESIYRHDPLSPVRLNALEADLGLAIAGGAYERLVHHQLSIRAALQITKPWYAPGNAEGGSVELRPFWLPSHNSIFGWYISPFGRVAGLRASVADEPKTIFAGWTAGITAGYGFQLWDRWLLRIGAGAQYFAYDVQTSKGTAGLRGFMPDVDLIVGYMF